MILRVCACSLRSIWPKTMCWLVEKLFSKRAIKLQRSMSNDVIALFVPTLGGGGAERVMVTLANGLAEKGHNIHLVVASAEGDYAQLVSEKVNLVDLRSKRMMNAAGPFSNYLLKQEPKVVFSAIDHANLLSVALCKIFSPRSKRIVSVHNSLTYVDVGSLRDKLVDRLTAWTWRNSDLVVTVSEGLESQVRRSFPTLRTPVKTIHNPIDFSRIQEEANTNPSHPWLLDNTKPLIVGAGRLMPQKNFPLLIDAFERVLDTHDARLVILGEGRLRENLEQIIESKSLGDKILLPGFDSNPYVWFRHSNIFVLSSDWEGLSMVLLEAMACGTQVVSTDCKDGPREILEGGRWGKLVPVGDAEELAKAILETIEHPNQKNVVIRAQEFDVSIAVTEYERAIDGVMS